MASDKQKNIRTKANDREQRFNGLRWRIILILIFSSLLPLLIISLGAWVIFGRMISADAKLHLQTVVKDHGQTIELFLDERLMALNLIANSYTFEQITRNDQLDLVFENLNKSYSNAFYDLGVIDSMGNHKAYVGPFSLLDYNYRSAFWFKKVKKSGRYVSDLFLGNRNVPHFILAVKSQMDGGGFWILRATVNPEVFSTLVSKGRLGSTGDCFLLDNKGRYQTSPKSNAPAFSESKISISLPHDDPRTTVVEAGDKRIIRTVKWINNGQWMLVAQQDAKEVQAPITAATFRGMGIFAVGAIFIVLATMLTTNHLVRLIRKADSEREALNADLIRASKLASLGEMATGLAHEINNPLGIILSEQTNIKDLLSLADQNDPDILEMMESVASTQKQVARCKVITQKMLQFGRKSSTEPERIDVPTQLKEIGRLMQQHAKVNNIDLCLEWQPGAGPITMDSTEFQQVTTNLINNAMQAVGTEGGSVLLSAWNESETFHLTVEDTGPGIPKDQREQVFEPFFTTRSVGKGTGLGLSVCYGILTNWRGQIYLEEEQEQSGAVLHIQLPLRKEGEEG